MLSRIFCSPRFSACGGNLIICSRPAPPARRVGFMGHLHAICEKLLTYTKGLPDGQQELEKACYACAHLERNGCEAPACRAVSLQRAEQGALDLWSLDLRLGRPRFLPQIAPKPFKIRGFGAWTENRGAPKTQIQRPQIQRPILGPLIPARRNCTEYFLSSSEISADRKKGQQKGVTSKNVKHRQKM